MMRRLLRLSSAVCSGLRAREDRAPCPVSVTVAVRCTGACMRWRASRSDIAVSAATPRTELPAGSSGGL